MSFLSQTRKGELSIYLAAVLWSLFPVITIITFSSITPLFSAAIGTIVAAGFFAFILTLRRRWPELVKREAWKDLLLVTLFLGILFYAFMFTGLKTTTAGNASILALMEVFFSFLILGVLLKHESLSFAKVVGGVLMITGALLVLLPKASAWQVGDFFIIAAALIAPFGNMYTQRARKMVCAETILFVRSLLGGLFLLLLAALWEPFPSATAVASSLGFLLVNGVLLLGLSKILWIEGIHRIPVTKAISLESVTPFFTLIVAYFVLGERTTFFQVSGLLPIIAGIVLLTKKER